MRDGKVASGFAPPSPSRQKSSQPRTNRRGPRQQRQRPQLLEFRRPLPVSVNSHRQNRHESHPRRPRRQSIIHIVANVQRHPRIASSQNLQQSIRIGLLPRHVIHRYDRTKFPRACPPRKRVSKFLPRPPGKKIQFKSFRPVLYLLGRYQHFLPPHISRPPIAIPIKLLKGVPRLLISRRPPQRRRPVRYHVPIVVVPRLVLPFVKLRPRHPLPGQKPHRLQRRAPETLAHIHQHAVHIENQNFRNRLKSLASAQSRQSSSLNIVG